MKPVKQGMTDRIEWVDCAKGIGILFVIIGYTVSGILRGAIFSFHMPLFFILSCAVFQYSADTEQLSIKTSRGFRHLVIPAILMYVLSVLTYAIRNNELFSNVESVRKFIIDILLTGIFSSGVPVKVFSYEVLAIGIPWFLIVLFFGRTLFDFLQIRFSGSGLMLCCAFLSALGVWLGKIQWLPCSLDIVFAIMPIFYIGANIAWFQVEQRPVPKFLLYGSVWAGTLLLSYAIKADYLELACRRYPLYPLSFVTAVAGTLAVVELSVILTKIKKYTYRLYIWEKILFICYLFIILTKAGSKSYGNSQIVHLQIAF